MCLQLFQNYIQYKYSSPINENVLAHNSYKDINEVLSEMKNVSRRETINEVSIESHGSVQTKEEFLFRPNTNIRHPKFSEYSAEY